MMQIKMPLCRLAKLTANPQMLNASQNLIYMLNYDIKHPALCHFLNELNHFWDK